MFKKFATKVSSTQEELSLLVLNIRKLLAKKYEIKEEELNCMEFEIPSNGINHVQNYIILFNLYQNKNNQLNSYFESLFENGVTVQEISKTFNAKFDDCEKAFIEYQKNKLSSFENNTKIKKHIL